MAKSRTGPDAAAGLTINDPVAATSTNPQKNSAVPIQPMPMPGMPPLPVTSGSLCACDGVVPDQGSATSLYAVYVVCKPGKDATFTDQDWQNSSSFVQIGQQFNGSDLGWSIPSSCPVVCALNGNSDTYNSILAHAMVYDPAIFNFITNPVHIQHQQNFLATSVASCSRNVAAASASAQPIGVNPTDRKGDWYHYRGISASLFGYGSRLMLNGLPLSANCIEVAAENVLWTRGLTQTRTITRAVGELIAAPPTDATHFYWVAGAPQSSLIVSQPSGLRSVLMSQSRSCPDVIVLDPNSDVYVGVNFNWFDGLSRNGTFDLWVKIVD